MNVIDKVTLMKERRVKQNSQEWLNGEIVNEIENHDRLFKTFKKPKLHIDKEIFNAGRYKLAKMIIKKRAFFENKLTECIGRPKDLWKTLRSLGLPSKTSFFEVNALKIKNTAELDVNSVLKGFRNYYSTLSKNLLKILPKPINK